MTRRRPLSTSQLEVLRELGRPREKAVCHARSRWSLEISGRPCTAQIVRLVVDGFAELLGDGYAGITPAGRAYLEALASGPATSPQR